MGYYIRDNVEWNENQSSYKEENFQEKNISTPARSAKLQNSVDPPQDKQTLRGELLDALQKQSINEKQFESFLIRKRILSAWANLRSTSPKVWIYLSRHWNALIDEFMFSNALIEENL